MPAVIFQGSSTKGLKNNHKLFDNKTFPAQPSADPRLTAFDAPKGSVLLYEGKLFMKLSDGSNTDVKELIGYEKDNFYPFSNYESATTAVFSSGNNASFGGGGTAQGTLSISSTAADLIRGTQVAKYVLNATPSNSDDDYIQTQSVDIPQGYRGRTLGFTLEYKYDGADNDIEFIVRDDTNAAILTGTDQFLIPASAGSDNVSKKLVCYAGIPTDCQQISFGFQVKTHATGSEELIWDDVYISDDPFQYANLQGKTEYYRVHTVGGWGSTNTKIPYYSNLVQDTTGDLVTADNSTTLGLSFTVNRACRLILSCSGNMNGSQIGVSVNSTQLTTNVDVINAADRLMCSIGNSANEHKEATAVYDASPGDVIRPHFDGSAINFADRWTVNFIAQEPEVDHVITPTNIGKTESYRARDTGGFASTNTAIPYYNTVDYDTTGDLISVSNNSTNGLEFTVNRDCKIWIDGNLRVSASQWGFTVNASGSTDLGSISAANIIGWQTGEAGNWMRFASCVYEASAGDVIRPHSFNSSVSENAKSFINFHAIEESKIPDAYLALPTGRVAYLKEVQTSGTAGGTFTSGSYQTRTLNTLEGDASFVSLSSNQFTLSSGKYKIWAGAPAYRVDTHKIKLRNITDATDTIIGESGGSGSTIDVFYNSVLMGVFEISDSKTFEIQHRCNTTRVSDGLGVTATYGDSEVYTQVRIEKIK